jgi:hypothetical protein
MKRGKGEACTAAIVIATGSAGKAKAILALLKQANLFNPILVGEDADETRRILSGKDRVELLFVELESKWTWDLLKWLEQQQQFPSIVGILEENHEALIDQAYEAGVKTCLKIPFTFGELLQKSRLLNVQYLIVAPPKSDGR